MTFGEVLMRINPLNLKKFSQQPLLDFTFGGTELNVSVSLSNLGFKARHVTILPDDFIGEAALNFMKGYGLNTKYITRSSDHPIGVYFLEEGAVHRPSKISYNRSHSAFAKAKDSLDWSLILKDAGYFHWTGVSAGVSENIFKELDKALIKSNQQGLKVIADITYRKNQWKFGMSPQDGLGKLLENSCYLISGVREMQELLGENSSEDFESNARKIKLKFPNLKLIVDKERNAINASQHSIKGRLFDGISIIETPHFQITHIIDRIGTGDAFAAGFIYGLKNFTDLKGVINFATAACALKHTIPGDANLSSLEDILNLMNGNSSGRIQR